MSPKDAFFVLTLATACSTFTAAAPSPATAEEIATRIARVESGLLPPAVIARAGSAPETWTLAARMEHYKIPGVSVAVIDGGELAWARGYGLARVGEAASVTPDTLFQAGAISQSIAAAVTLSLVESGRLSLDADVNSLLKTWQIPAAPIAENEPVTLRRLLSHTAGLSMRGFNGYAAGAPLPTLPQILDGAAPANSPAIRVLKKPGKFWLYSGGGYVVVQQLLADVSGETFADLARTRVLLPAGMTASSFDQPLSTTHAPLAAAGHDLDAHRLPGDARVYPELAAAGLWTTPTDLARFALALQHARAGTSSPALFSPAAAEAMITVPLAGSDYGLGLGVINRDDHLLLAHTGANAGFRAILVAYPRLGRGAVIMTNSDNGGSLIPELLHALARVYDWPDYRVVEKTAAALPPETFDALAGRYERDDTVLVFYRKEDHFYLRATNTARAEIFPLSDHEFFTLSSDAIYDFGRDDQGRVTHVIRRDGTARQLFRRAS